MPFHDPPFSWQTIDSSLKGPSPTYRYSVPAAILPASVYSCSTISCYGNNRRHSSQFAFEKTGIVATLIAMIVVVNATCYTGELLMAESLATGMHKLEHCILRNWWSVVQGDCSNMTSSLPHY